jgi:hypothetical protein
MKDLTTESVVRKTPSDLAIRALRALGNKIFRTDDCRARDRGWQVIPCHGGVGRTYRDKRFDDLAPCAACSGRGCTRYGVTCAECDGTGRLVLDSAVTSRQRREQL